MDVAVAARAGRELETGGAKRIFPAVRTRSLLRGDVPVTGTAVDRIEPSPVPAALGAGMTLEALHPAMRAAFQLRQVDLVAVVTGSLLLGRDCSGQ